MFINTAVNQFICFGPQGSYILYLLLQSTFTVCRALTGCCARNLPTR